MDIFQKYFLINIFYYANNIFFDDKKLYKL